MIEKYENDSGDILYYSTYPKNGGTEEVLQHKKSSEMAHITLHANGVVNLRPKRSTGRELKAFVRNGLYGFSPSPSVKLKAFLRRVKGELK